MGGRGESGNYPLRLAPTIVACRAWRCRVQPDRVDVAFPGLRLT